MEETKTQSIKVSATPEYLPHESSPELHQYAFAYHIDIFNGSSETVQLLKRHWIITDGNQKTEEVKGEGVVGEQPYIEPGERFRYSSGAILTTPIGAMKGAYTMSDPEGVEFEAIIPTFKLVCSTALH